MTSNPEKDSQEKAHRPSQQTHNRLGRRLKSEEKRAFFQQHGFTPDRPELYDEDSIDRSLTAIGRSSAVLRDIVGDGYEPFIERSREGHWRRSTALSEINTISQAADDIHSDWKLKHPDVPWGDITELRNHTIHEYTDVEWDSVWTTARNVVPRLVKQIEAPEPADPYDQL